MYDFIIAGAGLFGSVFAREATDAGYKCLVIEKRAATGGNLHCDEIKGITVHTYGPHIFHTSNKEIWDYFNRFALCRRFTNSPLANCDGVIYNLPFNMNTFHQMWGVTSPAGAKEIIERQRKAAGIVTASNLEEQAISLVGTDIYEKLIKNYTEKQWGRPCSELPPFIIKRLPVRFTYDNNYFNDDYEGIPREGYNALIGRLLEGSDVLLNTDYNSDRAYYSSLGKKTVYTGTLDSFYDFRFGKLEYRSLRFETQYLSDCDNFQGNAVINYTGRNEAFTRIIEHKHFSSLQCPGTVITKEYPVSPSDSIEPFYPVNDKKNNALYMKYSKLAEAEKDVFFGGRLAEYRYYDMDRVIESALQLAKKLL